jgi:hypothetical protein
MAARIVEEDFGTKRATKKVMTQLQEETPDKFDDFILKYWRIVEKYAKELCPVGTPQSTGRPNYIGGSLKKSIRIQKGAPSDDKFERGVSGRWVAKTTYYLVAGGGGIFNPNNRREVDYARAVHDGYYTGGMKRTRLPVSSGLTKTGRRKTRLMPRGRFIAGRPFLTLAIQKAAPDLERMINEYMSDKEKVWVSNQPAVGGVSP